jgi:hypothetical protein
MNIPEHLFPDLVKRAGGNDARNVRAGARMPLARSSAPDLTPLMWFKGISKRLLKAHSLSQPSTSITSLPSDVLTFVMVWFLSL